MGNLVAQGRGIRNDLLAAQVARANAQQREIQVRNRLSIAWATYNRYLCRPMDTVVPLEELATSRPPPPRKRMPPDQACLQDAEPIRPDEAQIQALVDARLDESLGAGFAVRAGAIDPRPGRRRTGQNPAAGQLPGRQSLPERAIPTHRGRHRRRRVRRSTGLSSTAAKRGGTRWLSSSARPPRSAGSDDLAADIKLQVRSAWLTCQENQAAGSR